MPTVKQQGGDTKWGDHLHENGASLVYIMVLYAVGVLSFSLLSYEVLYIKVRSIIRKLENHFTTYSHFFLSSSFNIPISKLTSTMYLLLHYMDIGYLLDIGYWISVAAVASAKLNDAYSEETRD